MEAKFWRTASIVLIMILVFLIVVNVNSEIRFTPRQLDDDEYVKLTLDKNLTFYQALEVGNFASEIFKDDLKILVVNEEEN